MDLQKTGALIAQARKDKGLTQQQLAKALHLSHTTVSKWERGLGFPEVSLLEPLAAELGLSLEELFRGEMQQGGPHMETEPEEPELHKGIKAAFVCLLLVAFVVMLGYVNSTIPRNSGGNPRKLEGFWQNQVRRSDEMRYIFTLSVGDRVNGEHQQDHYSLYINQHLVDEGRWTQMAENQYQLDGELCDFFVDLLWDEGYGGIRLEIPGLEEPVKLIKKGDGAVEFPDQESYTEHDFYRALLTAE